MGCFIAIGQWVWGVGSTEEEAVRNCRAAGPTQKIALYYSPTLDKQKNNVYINQMGCICWNGGAEDEPYYYAKIVGRKYTIMHPDKAPKDVAD